MIFILHKLIVMHFLLDFPLQGDFLARAKNHKTPIDGVPWQTCLAAHAIIQGGGVWLVTGSVSLALTETLLHAIIDWQKNQGDFGFNVDQLLHILCKVVFVVILWVNVWA
jgi:hypothetical protein